MQQAQDLCEERAYADYEYIVNSAGAWREKEIIKKEYFGQPVLCKFESLDPLDVAVLTQIDFMYFAIVGGVVAPLFTNTYVLRVRMLLCSLNLLSAAITENTLGHLLLHLDCFVLFHLHTLFPETA
jgi:hypothetical protein